MRSFCLMVFITILVIQQSDQYNILVVFPHFGKSHFLVFKPLFEKLSAIGHNITVISYFPSDKNLSNYHDVNLNDGKLVTAEFFNVGQFDNSRIEKFAGANMLLELADQSCIQGMSNVNFQNFLKQDNKYDLLLIEVFNSNCFFGLTQKFTVPVIGLSTCALLPWIPGLYGFEENPSYLPSLFSDLTSKMDFFQRVENTIYYMYANLIYNFFIAPRGYQYSKEFAGIDMRQVTDPTYNMSLLLINTHFTLIKPRPVTPNFIEVGGIHLSPPKKLPEQIENFISSSNGGVVYVCMGSVLKGNSFTDDKLNIFLKVFSRIPQKVIWKWENATLRESSKNILTVKWAPQRDILCHPNVKLFISHGGLLGTLEALDCGIPVITMPQYGDQFANARAMEAAGGSIFYDFSTATEESLLASIAKAMSPEFQEQVKTLSKRFKDRPLPPMDTALYWIEYIIRHAGAPYMKPASLDLPFYEYYLLDVIAFIISVIVVIVLLLIYSIRMGSRAVLGSRNNQYKEKMS